MTEKTSKELQSELAAAVKREEAERKLRQAATPILWEYEISPEEDEDSRFIRLYDTSCKFYRITGKVVNEEEARAAGHGFISTSGSMVYVYNKLSRRFVCSVGGGTVYISRGFGYTGDSDIIAMDEISRFIHTHPNGGDITEIVRAHKQRMRDAR